MDPLVYFRFALALALVLGLVLLAGWAARRFGLAPGGARRLRRGRRLGIVEVMPIDARRRLVLVRRDDKEHLLLLSTTRDLVVEAGIAAPPEDLVADAAADEPAAAPALPHAPSAAVPPQEEPR